MDRAGGKGGRQEGGGRSQHTSPPMPLHHTHTVRGLEGVQGRSEPRRAGRGTSRCHRTLSLCRGKGVSSLALDLRDTGTFTSVAPPMNPQLASASALSTLHACPSPQPPAIWSREGSQAAHFLKIS